MIWKGWMWMDDDPVRSIADKIKLAVERYRQKYGHIPDMVYINPTQVPEGELSIGPIKVLPAKNISPNTFYLGMTDTGREVPKQREENVETQPV